MMHYAYKSPHKDRRTRVRAHIYDKLVIIKTGRSHQTRSLNHSHPQETLPLRSPPNGASFTTRKSHRSRRHSQRHRSSDVNYYACFSPYRPGEEAIWFSHAELHAGVKDSLTGERRTFMISS